MKHYIVTFPCPPTTDDRILSAGKLAEAHWGIFSIVDGIVRIDCHPAYDAKDARLLVDDIIKELTGCFYTWKYEE